MNNPNALPTRSKTELTRTARERFHKLDASIKQNIAEAKKEFANTSKKDFPPDWVDQSGFNQFIKSRGIILTEADEIALFVLRLYFNVGAIISPEKILECLQKFNPARQLAEGE